MPNWVIVVIPLIIFPLGFLFKYLSLYILDQLATDKKRKEAQKPIKKPQSQDENLINVKWRYVKEKKKKENRICQKKIC